MATVVNDEDVMESISSQDSNTESLSDAELECQASVRGDEPLDRPADNFAKAAVSLSWLQRFAEDHKLQERGLTCAHVVSELVKPLTAHGRCSYAALLLGDEDAAKRDLVSQGRPFYFISHAWCRPFAETVALLAHHFAPQQQRIWRRREGVPLPTLALEEVFVWLDVFAVNQHGLMSGSEDAPAAPVVDLAAVGEVLQRAEETLMVLDSEQGAALSRLWCLYEAWRASGVPVGQGQRGNLRLLLYGAEIQRLEKAFSQLDVGRAQASLPADTDRLLLEMCGPGDGSQISVPGTGRPGARTATQRLKEGLLAAALAAVAPPGSTTGADGPSWTPDVGAVLAVAARLCALYGRMRDAEPLLRRDADGAAACLGPDHPRTLSAVESLAAYLSSRRMFEEAEPLCRRAAEGWARVRGGDHPATAAAQYHLATVLLARRMYDEAEPMLRGALTARERALGPEHPATVATAASLAALLKGQRRYGEAVPLYSVALVSHERTLGPEHPDTVSVLTSLAALQHALHDFAAAEPLYRRVLAQRERLLGPSHEHTLSAVSSLASTLLPLGRLDEAEAGFRRALAGRERLLGPTHYRTLASVHNLACVLAAQGRYDEAEPLCRRALAGREALLGPDHAETRVSQWNLALLLKYLGRFLEAEPHFRRVLADRERLLGPRHAETLEAALGLAEVLMYGNARYEEAEACFRRAVEGVEGSLGPGHPETLAALFGLAGLLLCRGRRNEAEAAFRRVVDGRDAALGAAHLDTIAAVHSLAELLAAMGKYGEAEGLYRRAAEGRRGQLGPGHPLTLASLSGLGCLLVYRGQFEEAAQIYRRILDAMAQQAQHAAQGPQHALQGVQLTPGTLGAEESQAALPQQQQQQTEIGAGRQSYEVPLVATAAVAAPPHSTPACVTSLVVLLASCGKYDILDPLHRRELGPRSTGTAAAGSGAGPGVRGHQNGDLDPRVGRHALAAATNPGGARTALHFPFLPAFGGAQAPPTPMAGPQHLAASSELLPGLTSSGSLPGAAPTPVPAAFPPFPHASPNGTTGGTKPKRSLYGRSVEVPRSRGIPLTASWPGPSRPVPPTHGGLVGWASGARQTLPSHSIPAQPSPMLPEPHRLPNQATPPPPHASLRPPTLQGGPAGLSLSLQCSSLRIGSTSPQRAGGNSRSAGSRQLQPPTATQSQQEPQQPSAGPGTGLLSAATADEAEAGPEAGPESEGTPRPLLAPPSFTRKSSRRSSAPQVGMPAPRGQPGSAGGTRGSSAPMASASSVTTGASGVRTGGGPTLGSFTGVTASGAGQGAGARGVGTGGSRPCTTDTNSALTGWRPASRAMPYGWQRHYPPVALAHALREAPPPPRALSPPGGGAAGSEWRAHGVGRLALCQLLEEQSVGRLGETRPCGGRWGGSRGGAGGGGGGRNGSVGAVLQGFGVMPHQSSSPSPSPATAAAGPAPMLAAQDGTSRPTVGGSAWQQQQLCEEQSAFMGGGAESPQDGAGHGGGLPAAAGCAPEAAAAAGVLWLNSADTQIPGQGLLGDAGASTGATGPRAAAVVPRLPVANLLPPGAPWTPSVPSTPATGPVLAGGGAAPSPRDLVIAGVAAVAAALNNGLVPSLETTPRHRSVSDSGGGSGRTSSSGGGSGRATPV